MKYLLLKDQRRRVIYSFFERKRRFLQALYQDLKLTPQFRSYVYHKIYTLPRDASITRLRNRCVLTNRPRAIYRRFGMSRLMFRKYAWQGRLIGVKKASW